MKYILKIIGFFSVSFYIISKIVYASDWVQLSETDSAIHYIQKKPEKTKSPIKEVWEMQDLKKITPHGEQSYRILAEYDCNQRQWRIKNYTSHARWMATGEILDISDTPEEWQPVAPGTPSQRIYDIVCGK